LEASCFPRSNFVRKGGKITSCCFGRKKRPERKTTRVPKGAPPPQGNVKKEEKPVRPRRNAKRPREERSRLFWGETQRVVLGGPFLEKGAGPCLLTEKTSPNRKGGEYYGGNRPPRSSSTRKNPTVREKKRGRRRPGGSPRKKRKLRPEGRPRRQTGGGLQSRGKRLCLEGSRAEKGGRNLYWRGKMRRASKKGGRGEFFFLRLAKGIFPAG